MGFWGCGVLELMSDGVLAGGFCGILSGAYGGWMREVWVGGGREEGGGDWGGVCESVFFAFVLILEVLM